ncbi:MAG: hypothetical protein LUO88_03075 [Methanoregulaceae archaeon]|nr:hypothetical protein [Methanoregulaceae archaeon]
MTSQTGGENAFPTLEREAVARIERELRGRPKATQMWRLLSDDPEVRAFWGMADYVVVQKLGMNDHGRTHAKIAAASALTMLGLLERAGVVPDMVSSGQGDSDDAALAVMTGALCHDFGNMIHREAHSETSIALVLPVLARLLPKIYDEPAKRTAISSYILSSIYSHHGVPKPITIEAALVCIGDSTDMTKGRGRAAFERGSITIHSVSALSIERVEIRKGKERPIELRITMSNSAGIFQVQEILAPKVRAGPLAGYVDVIAVTDQSAGAENNIVRGIRMDGSRFVPYEE